MKTAKTRIRIVLALPLLLVALPGCPGLTQLCKNLGICSRDVMGQMPPEMSPDFKLIVQVDNQQNPPADYLITINRDGTGEYRYITRAPVRREKSGKMNVLEGKLQEMWDTARAMDYPNFPPRIPESGDGADSEAGIQKFNVRHGDFPKEVVAVYTTNAGLKKLRDLAISTLPEDVIRDVEKKDNSISSLEVVGDTRTKLFYAPDSPLLREVPEDKRQKFPTYFAAYDFNYQPAADWRPPKDDADR